ncbi:MAG TPA: hypothetical protein VM432_02940 [Bdellovibrionales bacterium]|nr:hypothetical protein [Bdellovibrionales bacterium]
MTKIISIALILAAVVSMVPAKAHAAVSPVSVTILPPVMFPPNDFTITGLRMSLLYGKQRNIYGLDLGVLGNITEQDFTGIGISGLFNATTGTTNIIGLQLAGLTNINTSKTRVYGLQLALGMNYNGADTEVNGIQFSLANHGPHTKIYGAQLGIYNKAQDVYGFQIGLVNVADSLHGIQIGLLNFHHKGTFAVSPIINMGF